MSYFWRLFGYKSFVVNIDDYVRIEICLENSHDSRKIDHIYDIVQIKRVCKTAARNSYSYVFDKYSTKLYTQVYINPSPIYYSKKWGGMKPLTEEDKLQLL